MHEHEIDPDIALATDQDIDGINNLRSAIRASFTNVVLVLENIKQSGKHRTWVSRAGGQIVGYLSLHSSTSFQNDNEAEFEVGIHPDHEGDGRGSALVKEAEKYAQEETNLCRLIAQVKKGNSESEGMLRNKLGFRVLRRENLGSVLAKNIKR